MSKSLISVSVLLVGYASAQSGMNVGNRQQYDRSMLEHSASNMQKARSIAYFNNIDCRYQINAPAGHYIGISFDTFLIEGKNDFVSVYDGPEIDESKLIAKFDTAEADLQSQSTGNQMTLWFHTDRANTGKGWFANWVAKKVLPPINQFGTSGVVISPNYPKRYDSFINQLYNVRVNPRSRVRATMEDFEVEENFDNLLIYEGMVQEPRFLVANLSGARGVKWDHTFAGDSFSMKFASDRAVQQKGWRMSWAQV
ncbi:hypothetical protein WR25_19120 [Diploscapter pachys]|uniref:CUB domain-containing protein n=1 Tax=Diploscapter pachys TaxID=2018661 RepID=A0A2A2L349_9BILA|nr:hypothetical protein WR25_19120 [Diploscapter pachys]